MAFDLVEAKKAVARVKERSIGPETVHDLSALVAEATAHIHTLEADVHAAQTQRATESEQLHNQLADADRAVLAAIEARDRAIDTERQHSQILDFAIELDRLVADIDEANQQLADLRAAREAERAETAKTLKAAATTRLAIAAERDAAMARDAIHHDALLTIADLGWWERLKATALAKEAVRGPR